MDLDVKSFVYASSCAVYGEAEVLPIKEDNPLKPLSPYGVSKLAAENYVRVFYEVLGLEKGLEKMIVCVFAMERYICIQSVYKIMGAVVPVRVPRELAEKIRELVEAGVFSNRSVLVREALRRLVVSEGIVAEKTTLGSIAARIASVMIVWNEKAVTDVILFGSVARGEAAVESDVDLLVLVEDAEGWVVRQRLYDVVYPVILALGVDVSLIVVDRKLFIRMVEKGDPFALSVLRDGVQLHGGFVDEYGEGVFGKGN